MRTLAIALFLPVVALFAAGVADAGPGTRICYFGTITTTLPVAWTGQHATVSWWSIHADGSRYFLASEATGGASQVQYLAHTYGLLQADSTLGSTGETATGQVQVAGPTSARDCPSPTMAPLYSVSLVTP